MKMKRNRGWDGVTVEQFVEVRKILKESTLNPEECMIAVAAELAGVTYEELLNMPLEKAAELFEKANQLREEPRRGRLSTHYQVGNVILKLTPVKDLTIAQWVDFQTYGKDMEKNIVEILSVVLVPEGKKYNEGYDMDMVKMGIRRYMHVPEAMAVCFFFQRALLRSIRHTLNFWCGWTWMKGRKDLTKRALEVRRKVSAILSS